MGRSLLAGDPAWPAKESDSCSRPFSDSGYTSRVSRSLSRHQNRGLLRLLQGRATVLCMALLGLAVLAGSQAAHSVRPTGLRAHHVRRLKVSKDLLTVRVSKSTDRSQAAGRPVRPWKDGIAAPAGTLTARPGSLIPSMAWASLAKPDYLRLSTDPNAHTGPPV